MHVKFFCLSRPHGTHPGQDPASEEHRTRGEAQKYRKETPPRHYTPHEDLMKRLHLHLLSARNERDDNVAAIYRKSLLSFVSNALEPDLRTPILGLANAGVPDYTCLLYTSPSPRDRTRSRMPSSA